MSPICSLFNLIICSCLCYFTSSVQLFNRAVYLTSLFFSLPSIFILNRLFRNRACFGSRVGGLMISSISTASFAII